MSSKASIAVGFYSKHLIVPGGTTQLRCLQPAQYLKTSGYKTNVGTIYRHLPKKNEIVVLHRAEDDRYTKAFTAYARALGNPVLYDTDDLLFDEKAFEYLLEIGKKKFNRSERYKAQMQDCNHIVVSTQFLADEAAKYCSNVTVIRNALSLPYVEKSEMVMVGKKKYINDKFVTIAYLSGSRSHDRDFKVVEETLLNLLRDYPQLNFLVVGPLVYSSRFAQYGERFEHRDFIPYERFPELFKEIDINIIPLNTDDCFNHAKSELKYIEAAACGVPSVLSPTKTHLDVIDDGITGLIADNSREWYEMLSLLIRDREKRFEIAANAYNHTKREYYPEVRAKEWSDFIGYVVDRYSGESEKLRTRLSLKMQLGIEYGIRLGLRFSHKF